MLASLILIDALILAAFVLVGIVISRVPARTHLGAGTVGDAVVARRQKRLRDNTVSRLLDPWVRLVSGAVQRIGLTGHRRQVARRLTQAGNPWGYTAEEYVAFSAITAALIAGTFFLLFYAAGSPQFLLTILAFALILYLMNSSLKSLALQRRNHMDKQLPYFLDLISLSMGAGATFTQAADSIATGPVQGPMEEEVGLMLQQMRAGTPMVAALDNMNQRTESESLGLVVAAVQQADQLGTPLVNVFRKQAEQSRFLRSQRGEQEAGKLPNKLAIPNTLMMFCSLLILFGPIIVKAVRGDMF